MNTSLTTVGRRARRAFGRKGPSIMSAAPQPQPRNNPQKNQKVSGDFESFIDGAFRDHVVGTGAPPSAADPTSYNDIEPRELLRYAAGKATDDERTALEEVVKRSRWAYDRVVALVRSQRPTETGLRSQVGRRLMGAGGRTKTVAIVGQAILEAEGIKSPSLEDAWKTLEKSGSATARAACLIGLGRHDEARKLLEAQKTNDAACDLLRRVSSAAAATNDEQADDAALLALLDAFPSL